MASVQDMELDQDALEQNLQDQRDEVMALESIFADTDRLRVIGAPNNIVPVDGLGGEPEKKVTSSDVVKPKKKNFILQVDVKIELDDEGITLEAWVPRPDDKAHTPVVGAGPNKPLFERTVSGRRWNTSFRLKHLTPLMLEVDLPESYPAAGQPLLSLSCLWLASDQLAELTNQLESMWNEAPGMPVIYTWIDWLRYNVLSTLCMEETISLVGEDHKLETPPNNLENIIHRLLMYNDTQELEAFRQNQQTCGICYDEKMGSEFCRLADCRHHFCVDCLSSFSEYHIQEGTVQQLTCPEAKCKTMLPPNVLQAVLDDDTFDRWERLLFQNALATMGDIEWCPRCNSPVIREEQDALMLAHCTHCIFSFCTQCKDPWHQGTKCDDYFEEGEEELTPEELEAKKQKKVDDHYEQVQSKTRKRKQNGKSLAWIRSATKPCPKCRAPIEKNSGCNKVTCSNCLNHMCWICGKHIQGYDHFANTCTLWVPPDFIPAVLPVRPVPAGLLRVQQHMQDERQEAQHMLKKCPKCKQNSVKRNRDNHLHCWCCHTHFCFMCVSVLLPPIMSHYTHGSPCVQHSD